MTSTVDIIKLVESGEGQNLEFKSSFNAEVIETLVAFANADGGKVVIGVNNKCELSGVKMNDESGQNWIISAGRFSNRITIKDSATIRCDLFGQVEKILEFIKKHINKEFIITGDPQRQERWQYPLNAVREIVINMIVHRNYQDSNDAVIRIYNDRIEFFNPGKLLEPLTVEQLVSGNYSSLVRNKKIAGLFKEAGIIEQYGSGIQRILLSFKGYGLDAPVFENFQHGFRVVVFSKPEKITNVVVQTEGGQTGGQTSGQTGGQTNDLIPVSNTQTAVLDLIKKNNQITRKEIAAVLKINESAIQKHIDNLKLKKLLVRIGPDYGGHWEIMKTSGD